MVKKLWLSAVSLAVTLLVLGTSPTSAAASSSMMCVLENHPCTSSTPCCPNLTCWDETGQGHEGVCKKMDDN